MSLKVSPLLVQNTASRLAAAKNLCARAALFSREHYIAAAETFLRGLERRIDVGINHNIASLRPYLSVVETPRVAGKVREQLRNELGIVIAKRIYCTSRSRLSPESWQQVYKFGPIRNAYFGPVREPRIRRFSDTLYIKALAATFTVKSAAIPWRHQIIWSLRIIGRDR